MLHRNIASRYAKALFEIARDQGKLEAVEADFPRIANIVETDKDFHGFIIHPAIAAQEKKKMVKDLFGPKVNELLFDVLSLVIDKHREAYIPLMWEVFHELLLEHRSQVVAIVETPYDLPKEMVKAIADKLNKVTGKTVIIQQALEPSLIGGIRVRLGDRIVDGSVVSRLQQMKEVLRAVKV